jgi:hypothetical protein
MDDLCIACSKKGAIGMRVEGAAPPPTHLVGPAQLVEFREFDKRMTMIEWKLLWTGGGYAHKNTPIAVREGKPYAVSLDHKAAPYALYELEPGRIRQNSPIPGVLRNTPYRYLDDLHERDGISVAGATVHVVTGPLALPAPGEPPQPSCNSSLLPIDERFKPVIISTRAAMGRVRRVDIVFDGNEEAKGVSLVEERRLLLPDDCARKTILSVSVPLRQALALRKESYVRIRAGAQLYPLPLHFNPESPIGKTIRDVVSAVVDVQAERVFVAMTEDEKTVTGRTELGGLCGVNEADIVSVVLY